MTGTLLAELHGVDVLLVEDESLVSFLIEDMLFELGAGAVRHASRLDGGFKLAAEKKPGLAVLDVNLGGQAIFPLAETLARDGVPILFITGYGREGLGGAWADYRVLQKPLTLAQLAEAVRAALGARRG
ncbi:MAG: response regulator [Proteobacteria bacterium]|nr:response regulator [Pseudomonadota bacterium]